MKAAAAKEENIGGSEKIRLNVALKKKGKGAFSLAYKCYILYVTYSA
jgi:hypothetical protein